jgi:hypothetical protein
MTAKVMRFLLERREREPGERGPALAAALRRRCGVVVHPRTIERVLRSQGKKRRPSTNRRRRARPAAKR